MVCENCGNLMRKVLTNKTLGETLYKCSECNHRELLKEKADETSGERRVVNQANVA